MYSIFLYIAKLLYIMSIVAFKQIWTYFGNIIFILNKVKSGSPGHLFCG
jgi:hypothetical protein